MGLDIYFKKNTHIGYFRKVNFLLSFFEKYGLNVLEQTPLVIKKEWAEELLDRCCKVLEDHDKAPELLPTSGGLFFADMPYDESYFYDVKQVKEYIEDRLLKEFDDSYGVISFEISY